MIKKLFNRIRCSLLSMGYAHAIQLRHMYGYHEEAEYLTKELEKLKKECD